MAKNVITYGVQDLFFGAPSKLPPSVDIDTGPPNMSLGGNDWSLTGYTGQKSDGSPDGQKFQVLQRINKVQNFNYSIDLPKENINSVGSITNRASYVVGPPSVNLNFSYYADGINNEHRMGFSTQNQLATFPISFVSGLMDRETDKKNIYLAIDNNVNSESIRTQDANTYPSPPEGQPFLSAAEVKDDDSASYDFLIFINSYINSYSVNLGVGEVPTVNVGAVADNLFFTNGVDTGFGIPYINTETAATGFSGRSVIVPKNFINNANTFNYPESVFMPGEIKLTLSKRGADIISFQNETVQTCSIDLDLTRENIQYMGHKLPWYRPVTTPVGIKADFDMLVSGSLTGSVMEDLVYNVEYDINVDFVTGNVLGMNYKLSGLRLDSVQYDSSIGSNKTASLSFSSDFSLDDNFGEISRDKGFFVSGRVIQMKDKLVYSGVSTTDMGGIGVDEAVLLRTGVSAGVGSILDDKDNILYPRY